MAESAADTTDQAARPVLYAPHGGDTRNLSALVRAHAGEAIVVRNRGELSAALRDLDAILMVVITEEALDEETGHILGDALRDEPTWSRLPIISLVDDVDDPPPACKVLARMDHASPILLLKRPVPRATLTSALEAKRENRLRQFQTRRLLRELESAERHKDFLLRELRHRTGNSFAVLQAMLSLTARRATDVSGLVDDFSDRLRSLSRTHQAMGNSELQALPLDQILEDNVGPYCFLRDQLRLSGPPVAIEGHAVFNLAIVIHELATNSAKYGALTRQDGRIDVTWSVGPGEEDTLHVTWQESGGPRVEQPSRRGTGSEVIRAMAGDGAGMEFLPEGLRWTAHLRQDAFRLDEIGDGRGLPDRN